MLDSATIGFVKRLAAPGPLLRRQRALQPQRHRAPLSPHLDERHQKPVHRPYALRLR